MSENKENYNSQNIKQLRNSIFNNNDLHFVENNKTSNKNSDFSFSVRKSKINTLNKLIFDVFNHKYLERVIRESNLYFDDFKKLTLNQLFEIYRRIKYIETLNTVDIKLTEIEELVTSNINKSKIKILDVKLSNKNIQQGN